MISIGDKVTARWAYDGKSLRAVKKLESSHVSATGVVTKIDGNIVTIDGGAKNVVVVESSWIAQ